MLRPKSAASLSKASPTSTSVPTAYEAEIIQYSMRNEEKKKFVDEYGKRALATRSTSSSATVIILRLLTIHPDMPAYDQTETIYLRRVVVQS